MPDKPSLKDMSEQQIEDLRQSFNMFDRDGNGTIDKSELLVCLRALGHFPTDDELDQLMQQIDADGSGEVDFEEFAAVMATRADNEHAEKELQEIRATFNLFDSDRSGRVEADELRRALNILGIKLTKPEVDFLMSEIDEDKSGDISYEEFMNYVVQFDSKHKSHDPADHH